MSSFATAYRLSPQLAKCLSRVTASRGFQTSSMRPAAHNFTMPAMSPTMTEGNISKWNVKEGGSYSAGDVLLEIETDKANMDIEAQDDGILAKIIQPKGTKGVRVGARIAVIAEPGDDLSSIEIPPEEPSPQPKQEEASKESQAPTPPESQPPPPTESQPPPPTRSSSKRTPSPEVSTPQPSGLSQNPTYPLYPSVAQILHENHIPESEVEKIPASGPNGRLLKGDVLAYLGTIDSSYSAKQSKRIDQLSHLDLSNIKIASPKPAPPKSERAPLPEEPIDMVAEVTVPISLSQVLATQKRIQDTLGATMPLSTFIARAADIANDDLPLSKNRKPTPDELFNSVLGLDKISPQFNRGNFVPQITAFPPRSPISKPGTKQPDIIDILAGTKKKTISPPVSAVTPASTAGAVNMFSVIAPRGEEKRAKIFLERIKTILQVEPGRLVL